MRTRKQISFIRGSDVTSAIGSYLTLKNNSSFDAEGLLAKQERIQTRTLISIRGMRISWRAECDLTICRIEILDVFV